VTLDPSTRAPGDPIETAAGAAVIRGSALRTLGYGAGVVLNLVSVPLLVRHLGVVDFGRYVTVIALVTIVGGATDAGLGTMGLREHATGALERRTRVLRDLLGLRLALTGAGVAGAIVFAAAAGYTTVQVVGTAVAGAGLLLTIVQATHVIPLATRLALGWVTVLDLVRQVASVSLVVALVLAGAGLGSFFTVPLVAAIVALALTAWVVRDEGVVRPTVDRGRWRPLIVEALPFAAVSALGILYFRVTVILMSFLTTGREVGYFAASFRIVEALTAIPWLINSSAFPVLARAALDDSERLERVTNRIGDAAAILGVWVALCLGLGASVAIEVVAGEAFEGSVDVLRIQGPAILGTFLLATWGFALLSLRRYRELIACNAVALTVAAGVTVVLVPAHGAVGAAIATTAAELTLAAGYLLALARGPSRLRVSLAVYPRLALAVALALAPALLLDVSDAVAVGLATGVYFAVLKVTGAIPADVLRALAPGRGTPAGG
jgi:O-antigen/teichoic acid export membrane protein